MLSRVICLEINHSIVITLQYKYRLVSEDKNLRHFFKLAPELNWNETDPSFLTIFVKKIIFYYQQVPFLSFFYQIDNWTF